MTRTSNHWSRLAELQSRHPLRILLVSALLGALAFPLARGLELDSSWAALLPDDKPSVRDLRAAEDRIAGLSTLTIVVQSLDLETMQRFASELAPRLEALPERMIRFVDWNVSLFQDFTEKNRYLYADLADLEEIRDALGERLDYERRQTNIFVVDLLEEDPPEVEELVDDLDAKSHEAESAFDKYPDGFYVHADREMLVIFLRSDISGTDQAAVDELVEAIGAEINAVEASMDTSALEIRLLGGMFELREEASAIVQELLVATLLTITLVLLVVFLFFRSFAATPLLGLSLVVPVLVTFAIAELTVGSLNNSTAFLGSIVIGNGVNPNIIWLARYYERRRQGAAVQEAIASTHASCWLATLTASAAAGFAYGSLVLTDFRGFRDFGIIGGTGMLLCWLGAFTILPCLVAIAERVPAFHRRRAAPARRFVGHFFAAVVSKHPGRVLTGAAVMTALAVVLTFKAVAAGPIEYNFRNLRSVRQVDPIRNATSDRIDDIVGRTVSGDAIAVLASTRPHAVHAQSEIERRRDVDGAPFGPVRSIDNLLPADQERKLAVLEEISGFALELRRYADDAQRERIDEAVARADLDVVTEADLPVNVALPFTERDGARGRILFVGPIEGRSVWDGLYLMEWSDALRAVRDPEGNPLLLAGQAPVAADLIEAVWLDGPRAVLAAFLATCAVLFFAFRRHHQRLLSMGSLLVGIVWMAGTMALFGMKLNFLNFIAFPITFGNGVDYGVNLLRRIINERKGTRLAGDAPILTAVEETGGAVILCSLTTVIGYAVLNSSANLAIQSFGVAMVISEVTCVLAAVLALPAAVLIMTRREEAANASRGPDESDA